MNHIVGVDGGGTKTTAVVSDTTGNILGLGHSGPSNYHSVGLNNALKAIFKAIVRAAISAGIETFRTKVTSLGLAGVGRESDRAVMLEALQKFRASHSEAQKGIDLGEIILDHDAAIALAGATCGERGIIVVAGTGAIAFGENEKGERRRTGGWGHILDDEGSAYYVGQKILRAAFRAYDERGPATTLVDKLIQHFRVESLEEIVRRVYSPTSSILLESNNRALTDSQAPSSTSKDLVASLAPLADEAAFEGDKVSAGILNDAAAELALAAKVVIEGLQFGCEEFTLAYSGGVFVGSGSILSAFIKFVRNAAPKANIRRAEFPPAVGALMLGLKEYGVELTQEAQYRIHTSLDKLLKADGNEERPRT